MNIQKRTHDVALITSQANTIPSPPNNTVPPDCVNLICDYLHTVGHHRCRRTAGLRLAASRQPHTSSATRRRRQSSCIGARRSCKRCRPQPPQVAHMGRSWTHARPSTVRRAWAGIPCCSTTQLWPMPLLAGISTEARKSTSTPPSPETLAASRLWSSTDARIPAGNLGLLPTIPILPSGNWPEYRHLSPGGSGCGYCSADPTSLLSPLLRNSCSLPRLLLGQQLHHQLKREETRGVCGKRA